MTARATLAATTLATALACAGCGYRVPDETLALRCPRARPDDDIDHVLQRIIDPARLAFPTGGERNPFVRYRTLWHGYQRARAAGRTDAEIVEVIERLDRAVADVDGHGFRITPFHRNADLGVLLEPSGRGGLLVKDETGNVSGSHKARHLFGTMLELLLAGVDRRRPLAIASCGNAALAAGVVARAARWPLLVFVPEEADPSVLARLTELGAAVTTCARHPGETGDPPYLRMREAIADGAVPFTCQGNENGLAIEGGLTLGYEMADVLRTTGQRLDRLFVQVGGGALASSVMQGLTEARSLGVIDHLPRLHAVQTRNAHPVARAYDLVVLRLLERGSEPYGNPTETLRGAVASGSAEGELTWIAHHRSQFMWPWTPAPHSVAGGILDDETYDWLAVVHGMLATGGSPVLVDEELLLDATELARTATGIDLDPTGTSGLAGLLRLRQDGAIHPDETSAVLFTGIRRNGERP
jgi:threonine synthase